jgi:hypothetical protein
MILNETKILQCYIIERKEANKIIKHKTTTTRPITSNLIFNIASTTM